MIKFEKTTRPKRASSSLNMATPLRIGFVPEHFSTPLHFAQKHFGLDATLVPFPSGTGHMITALRSDEIDIGIGLTEAWIAGLGKEGVEGDGGYRLVGTYVETPLCWAISTGAERPEITSVDSLKGGKIGVSRIGSGSYVMGYVLADQNGWLTPGTEPYSDTVVLNTFENLRNAVNSGAADFFMWEHFTSKKFYDSGEIRRVGEIYTPWSSWKIVASTKLVAGLDGVDARVKDLFEKLDKGVAHFNANPEEAVQYISTHLDYSAEDAREWLKTVRFPAKTEGVKPEVVSGCVSILRKAGVLAEGKGMDANEMIVSSLWFDCGIEHLWSARDACIHLLAVSPERRQIYASKMRYMNVWYANEHRHWLAFEGLKFRRLKHFTATVSSILPFGILTHMMDYCVRSLQTFDFNGPHVSADLLGLLQDNCPNLKHAWFHAHEHPGTTAEFAEFIRNMRFLKVFIFKTASFSNSSRSSIDGDFLSSLARRNSLINLQVPWDWSVDAVDFATRQLGDLGSDGGIGPFPSLEKLSLSAASSAMQKLAPMLRNLSCLRLTVRDADADAIEPLRELVNLRILEVTFRQSAHIPGASLAALATLSKLETLELKPLYSILTKVTSCFSDADLELVASHWPRLRFLSFGVNCAVSARGCRSLALHCRELRRWELAGPLRVDQLLADGLGGVVLFPELEHLRFEGFAGIVYDGDRYKKSTNMFSSSWVGSSYFHCLLECHFPQLREIVTPHCRIRLSEHAFTEAML
ncbi:hypothetical protein CCMA1212_003888 [Trichoderma ghanense]|uniref:Ca3427-like PBP 2 domain-containing protein n=1 Tax=Trichoderma ghanense TaxID=65468 RepID=A0ABY2H7X2_9HYPO